MAIKKFSELDKWNSTDTTLPSLSNVNFVAVYGEGATGRNVIVSGEDMGLGSIADSVEDAQEAAAAAASSELQASEYATAAESSATGALEAFAGANTAYSGAVDAQASAETAASQANTVLDDINNLLAVDAGVLVVNSTTGAITTEAKALYACWGNYPYDICTTQGDVSTSVRTVYANDQTYFMATGTTYYVYPLPNAAANETLEIITISRTSSV